MSSLPEVEWDSWWAKNHPWDWWAKERDGVPLSTFDRLLVSQLARDLWDDAYRSGVEAGVRAGLEAGAISVFDCPSMAGERTKADIADTIRSLSIQQIVDAVLKGDKHG